MQCNRGPSNLYKYMHVRNVFLFKVETFRNSTIGIIYSTRNLQCTCITYCKEFHLETRKLNLQIRRAPHHASYAYEITSRYVCKSTVYKTQLALTAVRKQSCLGCMKCNRRCKDLFILFKMILESFLYSTLNMNIELIAL